MILRFQTKLDKNGNHKQIEYNSETNTAKYGSFVFIDASAIRITSTEYKALREQFEKQHCWMQPE